MFTIRTETNWDCGQTEEPGLSGTENPDFTRPQSQKCQVGHCYTFVIAFWCEFQCRIEKNWPVSGVGNTPFMGPLNGSAMRATDPCPDCSAYANYLMR